MSEVIAGTYQIIKKIGSGGGGNVFLAYHLRLDKKVVLKADKRQLSTRPELLRVEVDVLKHLSHQYIPQVYDFFVENDTVYTAMAYIEGESFDKALKRGERFSQSQVIKWGIQLLEALSYLHSPIHGEPPHGYTHSDIKPANLMLTPLGDICLIDFNISLALGEDTIIGRSEGYASPEHYGLDFSNDDGDTGTERVSGTEHSRGRTSVFQRVASSFSGRGTSGSSGEANAYRGTTGSSYRLVRPDVRSDIYSTGATLYHLLSGKRPAAHAKKVVPLSEKEFSPQLVRIIRKAMEPNPNRRYQTADEMLEALRENPVEMALRSPVSGFEIQSWKLKEAQLSLDVSEDYKKLSATAEVLVRAALVRSPYEKTRIKLYFANASGDGLVESLVTRVYSTNISMEKLVVEQLVAGPGEDSPDSYPVLNPNTRVLGVTVKDGTCYVNFDDGFLTQTNNTTGEVVIYAIANSLIELPNVNKVQIAVNGRTDLIYRETFDLSTIFDRNLDLVYNSDGEEE